MASPASRAVPVDPSQVEFTKSKYPAASKEVQQFAVDAIRNAGEWFIVLDVRPRLNARYTRRRPIGCATGGFYKTEATAQEDMLATRMRIEGFEERGGAWYDLRPNRAVAPPAVADQVLLPAAVPVVLPAAGPLLPAADPLAAAGPLPRGRPNGGEKREHAIDADDDDARDEMYLRKSKQFRGRRKSMGWGNGPSQSPRQLKRTASAAEAAEARAEAAKQYREASIAVLRDAIHNGDLGALLVDVDRDEDAGDLYVSEAQERRVRLQAIGVMSFYMIIGESYDEKGREWCMSEAALRCGNEVKGSTIYKWSLEFREHDRHFKVDKRGTYERCVFVDNEDVKLRTKSWIKSNLRHLNRNKFARYVNNVLIPSSVEGDAATVASIMKEKYHVTLPVCPETCGMWMLRCGAKYCAKTQSFYHDKHEDPDNRAARVRYIRNDLGTAKEPSMREKRQYQWIQMTLERAEEFVEAHKGQDSGPAVRVARIRGSMFKYKSRTDVLVKDGIVINTPLPAPGDAEVAGSGGGGGGSGDDDGAVQVLRKGTMLAEFHVEVSELLDEWRDNAAVPFGGHLSARILPCVAPLFVVGQDEAIFSSDAAAAKHWTMDGVSFLTFAPQHL